MAIQDKQLAKTLVRLRKARGLTQREVAAKSGFTVSFISYMETGRRGVSNDVLNKLAAVFRVPSEVVLFLAADRKTNRPELASLFDTTRAAFMSVLELEKAAFD
jgi:transcriptional regulator with XRE-family HTH domain